MSATDNSHQPAGPCRVPILAYHSLDDSGSVVSTPPDRFRRQMQQLRAWGYVGVTLDDVIDGWAGEKPLPARPVVITFDDGYASVLDRAAPILDDVQFPATLFAVSGYCGRMNNWPTQPADIPRMPLLSWTGLSELASAGFEIGAHTRTHPWLTAIDEPSAIAEIAGSRQAIEDRLGRAVTSFAYPYGACTRRHRAAAAAQFRAACTTQLATAEFHHDRLLLPRIDAFYLRHPSLFRLLPTVWAAPYFLLRQFGRRMRRRGEGL